MTYEQQWRLSLKQYTDKELVAIFPEAISVLSPSKLLEIFPNKKHCLEKRLFRLEQKREELTEIIEELLSKNKFPENSFTYWFKNKITEIWFGEKLDETERKIKELEFTLFEPVSNQGIIPQMIEQAKMYPFENLIEVNKKGMALCPFHSEKKPSFYIKKNFGYCFGCSWHGDTIQFVMETENLRFPDAVRKLCYS